jgi:GNAT superfamily N-acetyltransferase
MDIRIREATQDDIDWINSKYKEVKFLPSELQKEIVAIAEVDGLKAGLGRLVKIDNENLELGGMLVFAEYRKLGLSKKIIEFLLDHAEGKRIYCIPFVHLFNLYNSFGFTVCEAVSIVPRVITDKFEWCKKEYEHEVLLLIKD